MPRPRPTFVQSLIRSEPVRVAQLAAGALLIVAAPVLATFPQPIPIGIIVFGFGLALILRNSLWARRKYVRWQHRNPRAGRITDLGLRRRRRKVPLLGQTAHTASAAPEPQAPPERRAPATATPRD